MNKELQRYLNTDPHFKPYRYSNRGEFRVLRCEFPQLMGDNQLKRPDYLPRSLHHPYISGPFAPIAASKERKLLPHDNDVDYWFKKDFPAESTERGYTGSSGRKSTGGSAEAEKGKYSELDLHLHRVMTNHGTWGTEDAREIPGLEVTGPKSHGETLERKSANEKTLRKRRQRFPHFILFREDAWRQTHMQESELAEMPSNYKMESASHTIHNVRRNIHKLHHQEKVHSREYFPQLYIFNPMRCKFLGIKRHYCQQEPIRTLDQVLKTFNQQPFKYGKPPDKKRGTNSVESEYSTGSV